MELQSRTIEAWVTRAQVRFKSIKPRLTRPQVRIAVSGAGLRRLPPAPRPAPADRRARLRLAAACRAWVRRHGKKKPRICV
ncbi:MAG: hypothetical protein JSR94_04465 [Proteobacteria bacterium]|nr:hypothetical protein [Pseudomonadota bacterium]